MDNKLPELRDRDDLSQAELAAAVGVSRQTINAIERERYDPSLELAFELAAFFDRPIEELFEPDLGESSDPTDENGRDRSASRSSGLTTATVCRPSQP